MIQVNGAQHDADEHPEIAKAETVINFLSCETSELSGIRAPIFQLFQYNLAAAGCLTGPAAISFAGIISIVQMAAGRIYMEAR